jgi:integral membrane sensor domain MASE1
MLEWLSDCFLIMVGSFRAITKMTIEAPPSLAANRPGTAATHPKLQMLGIILGLAVVYFAAAKLGLTMAVLAEQVSAVWPPTGIALVAVLVFGFRVWPGIWLGAFLPTLWLMSRSLLRVELPRETHWKH